MDKTKILEIANDLHSGKIEDKKGKAILLQLLGLSNYIVVHDTRKLGTQQIGDVFKDLESAEIALEINKEWFDGMYIVARVDTNN